MRSIELPLLVLHVMAAEHRVLATVTFAQENLVFAASVSDC